MAKGRKRSSVTVLAGVNGAGKSSVLTAPFLQAGVDVFNPDEAAQLLISANPGLSITEANGLAWSVGKRLLETAIDQHLNFAFETTLGGRSIAALLERAVAAGGEVRVLYVGLESPALHIARVKARVAAGGHDIPDDVIRSRFDTSRDNLITLLPNLTELRVFDNSAEANPLTGRNPEPIEILRMSTGEIVELIEADEVPAWAKPIVAAALRPPPRRRRQTG